MARLTFRYTLRNDDGETDAHVHELMAVAVPAPLNKLGPSSYGGGRPGTRTCGHPQRGS